MVRIPSCFSNNRKVFVKFDCIYFQENIVNSVDKPMERWLVIDA